jgi:hypothetical protein
VCRLISPLRRSSGWTDLRGMIFGKLMRPAHRRLLRRALALWEAADRRLAATAFWPQRSADEGCRCAGPDAWHAFSALYMKRTGRGARRHAAPWRS